MSATTANIGHLEDVKDTKCVAAPTSCTRMAFVDDSGVFLCNDISLSDPKASNISEMCLHFTERRTNQPLCGDLIGPAKNLFKECRFANFYTFGALDGVISSGAEKVPYHLRIAGEGW